MWERAGESNRTVAVFPFLAEATGKVIQATLPRAETVS